MTKFFLFRNWEYLIIIISILFIIIFLSIIVNFSDEIIGGVEDVDGIVCGESYTEAVGGGGCAPGRGSRYTICLDTNYGRKSIQIVKHQGKGCHGYDVTPEQIDAIVKVGSKITVLSLEDPDNRVFYVCGANMIIIKD